MANLLLPNIAGSAMQGFQQGRNMAANRLIGLAMQNPDQSSQYFGQAAQINPGAVLDVQNAQARQQYMQGLGQVAQEKAAQSQQSAALQKIGAAARYMAGALQTNDPNKIEGAYQAVRPYLAELGQAQGKQPPAQWDPSMTSAIYHVIAQTASAFPDDMKLQTVTPGSVVTRGGEPVYSNPAAAKIVNGYAVTQGQNGNLVAAPIPVRGAGAPAQAQAQGLDASVPGTNGQNVSFNFPPGTPPEVIAAAKASAVANGDIAPDAQVGAQPQAPQGQPQTLADVAASKGTNQGVIAQRAQQIQALKARGVQMTPEDEQQYLLTGKASNFQGNSTAALFGDPSLTGSQYVASIPAGNQEIVKGLLNGTVSLPTGTTLKSPLWQSALASVKHADPSWNQAAYKQFADTRKFMTTGQGGQLVNSINTAAQHLEKLRDDINAMHNGNVRPLAAASNFLSSHFAGDQAPTNFTGDLTPVASELAAVYKGKGVPSDEEIRHFREALTPNMSYGQQMNVIRGWIDLLAGKLNATREQYRASMSKLSDPLSVINPRAAEALERITSLANDVSTTGRHAMPSEDTAPINAPGQQAPQAAAPTDPALDALLKKYGGG